MHDDRPPIVRLAPLTFALVGLLGPSVLLAADPTSFEQPARALLEILGVALGCAVAGGLVGHSIRAAAVARRPRRVTALVLAFPLALFAAGLAVLLAARVLEGDSPRPGDAAAGAVGLLAYFLISLYPLYAAAAAIAAWALYRRAAPEAV